VEFYIPQNSALRILLLWFG